ncbi:MAG: fhaA [Nocardioidaceae bacterium]|nr:fhaA [Nocardioidaceae bacterium]
MGGLRRFEDRLEQLISGAFARTFRSAVQPVEISAALNREVDNSAQILSRDRRLVPNKFHVELSGTDVERLDALGPALISELTGQLREHAAQQSYVFTGPVMIELESSDELTTGRFRVRSQSISTVSSASGDPSDTQVRRAAAVLEVNGKRHPLVSPGLVIGRGNEADLRITDPGVSRRHAEIRVDAYGDPPRISVHDLGSTNGISVNGKKVESAVLADGAQIHIGTTTMTVNLLGADTGASGV